MRGIGKLSEKKSQPSERELAHLLDAWDNVEKDPRQASKAMERAVNKYPEFAAGWGHLGLARMQCGEAQAAEAALLTAVNLEPDSPGWRLALSTLYKLAVANARGLIGKIERIRTMAESGVEVSPDCLIMPPDYITQITVAAIGCTYEHARTMAEQYAKDVLNMTRDKDFTQPAINNLIEIQTADQT